MPAPKKINKSELFKSIETAARSTGDNAFCAVVAVAAATGESFEGVQRLMDDLGRKRGQGTPTPIIEKALAQLGAEIEEIAPYDIIKNYPGVHAGLKSVTTHQPDRFSKRWPSGVFMIFTAGHVLTVIDGENIDWTRGRAMRAKRIWKVS